MDAFRRMNVTDGLAEACSTGVRREMRGTGPMLREDLGGLSGGRGPLTRPRGRLGTSIVLAGGGLGRLRTPTTQSSSRWHGWSCRVLPAFGKCPSGASPLKSFQQRDGVQVSPREIELDADSLPAAITRTSHRLRGRSLDGPRPRHGHGQPQPITNVYSAVAADAWSNA
jgi:hypothetical protein